MRLHRAMRCGVSETKRMANAPPLRGVVVVAVVEYSDGRLFDVVSALVLFNHKMVFR